MPNPGYHLYKCRELTLPLEAEEAHRSSISRRFTRSQTVRSRRAPQPPSPEPEESAGWAPAEHVSAWDLPPQPQETGDAPWSSGSDGQWQDARTRVWGDHANSSHSYSSRELPRSSSVRGHSDYGRQIEELTDEVRGVRMQQEEVRSTFSDYAQSSREWQQTTDARLTNINNTLQQSQASLGGLFDFLGYHPDQ